MRAIHVYLPFMLLLALPVGAGAGEIAFKPGPQQQQAMQARWAALDRNQDGFLDRAEAAARPALAEHFDALDSDRNGRLTQSELRISVENYLRAADADGDGAIDRTEAEAGLPRVARFFDRLDANGDGKLTIAEVQAMAARFSARQGR